MSAITSEESPSPDNTSSPDALTAAAEVPRSFAGDGAEDAISVLARLAKTLPSCLAASGAGRENRTNLIRKLDELEAKLKQSPASAKDLLMAELAELDAALQAWRQKPTGGPRDEALAMESDDGGTAVLPSSGEANAPGSAASESEASNRAAAADSPGRHERENINFDAASRAEGERKTLPVGSGRHSEAAQADYPQPPQPDRLSRQLRLSLTKLAAMGAALPSAIRDQGVAARAESSPAPGGEQGHYEPIARQIKTVHRQLAAQIEAGLTTATSEMAALKSLVGALSEEVELLRPPRTEQTGEGLETKIARLAARLDQTAESLAPLAALEGSVGEMSARLDELFATVMSVSNQPGRSAANENPACEGIQDILREIAGLRAVHEETANRADAAFSAIRQSLEDIACLCARMEASAKAAGLDRWGAGLDPSDPFAPILNHLKQHGEDGALKAKGWADRRAAQPASVAAGAAADEKERTNSSTPAPAAGSMADTAGFLIEPGLGFPCRRESDRREEGSDLGPSQVCDEQVGRTDFIAAARRAARRAQMEQSGAIAESPPESGTRNKLRSLAAQSRAFLARHRRLLIVGAALLIAAGSAFVLERALVRLRLVESSSGFLGHRQESAERTKPEAVDVGQGDKSLASAPSPSTTHSGQPAANRDQRADAIGTPASDPLPAKQVPLDPLAPQSFAVPNALGGQSLRAARAIPGSDTILAATMRPAGSVPPAGSRHQLAPAQPSAPGARIGTRASPASVPSRAEPDKDLIARAEAGDVAAQFELGTRYAEGAAGGRNYELAAQWYDRAAQQGHAVAQYRLASLYEKGLGVDKSLQRAKDLYERAAENGNVRAMHNLGVLAAEGDDGKPNYTSAALWFGKAAEYGIRDSQFNLAVLLARGLGVPKDLVKSYTWFAIVAAAGDADAARKRDEVAARLTASELAAANAVAAAFAPRPADRAANEASPSQPPGEAIPAQGQPVKPKVSGL